MDIAGRAPCDARLRCISRERDQMVALPFPRIGAPGRIRTCTVLLLREPPPCRWATGAQGSRSLAVTLVLVSSAQIQASSRPPSIDSSIADDQTDPRTYDRRIGQIDVLANQPRCALAPRIDEPLACSVVPVEQDVDTILRGSRFGSALLPFVPGISRDCRIRAAIPATGPMSLERVVLIALAC